MKKIIVLLSLFIQMYSFGQFSFTDHDGNTIANGSVFSFATANSESAKLKFYVTNVGATPVDVRIRCTGISGGDGVGFQLCYGGLCHDNVVNGVIYPDYQFLLNPGESNGEFDYFVNNFAGETPIDFNFQVYGLDSSGFATGQSVTMTYRYDSTLNVNSFDKLSAVGINIDNTLVTNELNFSATTNGKVALFNLNGQLIKEFSFTEGNQSFNLSQLSSAIYIARFSNNEGQSSSIKLIKK